MGSNRNNDNSTKKFSIPAYQGSDPYIFISYAHEDSYIVYKEIERFHNDGYKVWYDQGIISGRRWMEVVETALVESSLFVIFVSKKALESDNVLDEISLAKDKKIDIVSIYLEECELEQGVGLSLTSAPRILKYNISENEYISSYRDLFEGHGFKLSDSDINTRIDKPPFHAYEGKDPYIFISYAHDDSQLVFSDIVRFHDDGFNIWYDDGIRSGKRWQQVIQDAIVNAFFVVVFISNTAVESDNVWDEISFAKRKGKTIIPIFIESTKLKRGFELALRSTQSIYRFDMSDEGYVERYRRDFKENGLKMKSPQREPSNLITSSSADETDQLIKIIENKYASLDEKDRNYFIQTIGLYSDATSNQNEKLMEFINGELKSILTNAFVDEYMETIENAPDILSYPSLLLNIKMDSIRYEIIQATFLELEKLSFNNKNLAEYLIRQGNDCRNNNDIEGLEKTVVELFRESKNLSAFEDEIDEPLIHDDAEMEKHDGSDEVVIDDFDTPHLKEFSELNTTTNSLYDLEGHEVLIILKDGTNLTNWDDVENNEDILYVSEDLSGFTDLSYKYLNLTSLKAILATNVTCNATNMKYMFSGCSSLEDISSLEDWSTGNVVDMNGMFKGCSALEDISSLKDWNTENVEDMNGMFDGCSLLEDISALNDWRTTNLSDISGMFYGCSSLIDTNSLKNWDTGNLRFMTRVFRGCTSLVDVSALKNWDIANVSDMNGIFKGCTSLVDIFSLKNWNVANITDLSGVFYDCSSLTDILDLKNWKTKNVSDMSGMFKGCSSLEDISAIKDWKTANVVDMSEMFEDCSSLEDIFALKNWNTKKLKDVTRMFHNCSSLEDASALDKWDVNKVMYKNEMFDGCNNIEELPRWYD